MTRYKTDSTGTRRRPGGQPAAGAGLWKDAVTPARLHPSPPQFAAAYWMAESAALPECAEPLFALVADLAATVGYYRRPSYSEWMARTRTPEGFELHSALSNARAEVVQHIMGFLTLDETQLAALEKAARAEG